MSSFKSDRNIQKKECGPDRSVSDNQSSSVTLNEQAVNAIIIYCNFEFQQRSHTMTDINLNVAQITKGLDTLRAKKTFIRKKLDHTAF